MGFHSRVGRNSVYRTVAERIMENAGNATREIAGGEYRSLAESATAMQAVIQLITNTNTITDQKKPTAALLTLPRHILMAKAMASNSKTNATDIQVKMAKKLSKSRMDR